MDESTFAPSLTSSLAAQSAHISLKRARVLFDVNPYAAFVPTTDPIVAQASLERRIRRSQPPQQYQGLSHPGGSSSQALAVISTSGTAAPSTSKVSSSTLTIHREDESTTDGKSSGILVVSSKTKEAIAAVTKPIHPKFPLTPFSRCYCPLQEIDQEHVVVGQNSNSHLACSLEIIDRLIQSLGVGPKYCHGPDQ
jgi:hypothetical protein